MSRRRHIHETNAKTGPHLSEEQLMAYLANELDAAERRQVEEMLSREGMEGDAIEGLMALNSGEIHKMRGDLNASLHGMLKKRRPRRGIGSQRWILLAIVLILLLVIFGYWVIFLAQKGVG